MNSSQIFELLALPTEDTEKFIEVKKTEGNPVKNMTVKQLRGDVQTWKNRPDNEKAKVENLFADLDQVKKELAQLQAEQSKMVQRIQDFKREHPEKFGKMCAAFLDFNRFLKKED